MRAAPRLLEHAQFHIESGWHSDRARGFIAIGEGIKILIGLRPPFSVSLGPIRAGPYRARGIGAIPMAANSHAAAQGRIALSERRLFHARRSRSRGSVAAVGQAVGADLIPFYAPTDGDMGLSPRSRFRGSLSPRRRMTGNGASGRHIGISGGGRRVPSVIYHRADCPTARFSGSTGDDFMGR